ncbi:MAG TPA: SxtJ family membrane protein [Planctomycetota bacterium]|nr:SxtJ family membrane protein [Planctomycetota bacterium]
MALIEMNWHPTPRECRRFGVAALVASTLLAAVLVWWRDVSLAWAGVLVAAGVLVFALALISEKLVRPVYVGLTLVTLPLGLVLSFVVLVVFFYGVLTPIGLVMRLFGRDPLRRRWDPDADTYWTPHRPAERAARYFNQF